MSYNFKQYDSRWAKKHYCTPGTMASDGCGPTAVADLVYNLDKKITPWKVAQWMTKNGYSTKSNGTMWGGITAALKHYGFEAEGPNMTMAHFISEMSKNLKGQDVWGIILFKGGTKGGVTWTLGGHYMAVVDYKKQNGKDYFYMYDSGTRGHNGWYCYQTTMQGLCACAYIAKKKSTKKATVAKTATTTPSTATTESKAKAIVRVAKALAWPLGTASSKWTYKTGAPTDKCKAAMKKYTSAQSKKEYSDCGIFVNTVVRMAGVDKSFACLKWKHPSTFKVAHRGAVTASDLKAGDIIRYKKTDGTQHTLIYLGDGKIAEGGREIRFPIIRKSTKYNSSSVKKSTLEVLRAVE